MMFRSVYIQKTNKYLLSGFRRRGLTYTRVCNDVMHTFTPEFRRGKRSVTVEFGVIPLSIGIGSLVLGTYRLDQFTTDDHAYEGGWKISTSKEESVRRCVDSMVSLVDEHLIPLFDRCKNCSAALNEMIQLDKRFHENRMTMLRRENIADAAEYWENISLSDHNKYFMALKAKDYEYAQRHIDRRIFLCEALLQDDTQPEFVIDRTIEEYAVLNEQRSKLFLEDFRYFADMVAKGEAISMAFLQGKNVL